MYTVLYQFLETGTSDRCLICIVLNLRFSSFSLYHFHFSFTVPLMLHLFLENVHCGFQKILLLEYKTACKHSVQQLRNNLHTKSTHTVIKCIQSYCLVRLSWVYAFHAWCNICSWARSQWTINKEKSVISATLNTKSHLKLCLRSLCILTWRN